MKTSLIITCHNKEEYIRDCIESCLAQTSPVEIIIVNDGSTDGSEEIIEEYRDKVYKILCHHIPYGCQFSCNIGAKHSRGDTLFFCDGDAILAPNCIEKLQTALDAHAYADIAYCNYARVGAFDDRPHIAKPFSLRELTRYNYISQMSLIKKYAFPGFDERLGMLWDWDLWMTMCIWQSSVGILVDEMLFIAHYKEGDNTLQGQPEWDKWYNTIKLKHLSELEKVLRENFNESIVRPPEDKPEQRIIVV